MDLAEKEQNIVRDFIRRFNRAYSYITNLVSLHDEDLFNEFQYTTNLVKILPRPGTEPVDIDDKIKLEYASFNKTFEGQIFLTTALLRKIRKRRRIHFRVSLIRLMNDLTESLRIRTELSLKVFTRCS